MSLELNPINHKVLFNRGFILNRLGRFNEAIQDYLESIDINPGNPYAFYNLGIAYNKIGLLQESIKAFS